MIRLKKNTYLLFFATHFKGGEKVPKAEVKETATVLSYWKAPSQGGVISIVKTEYSNGAKPSFDAFSTTDFVIQHRLFNGSMWSVSLEETMRKVREWEPRLQEITDFGEYPLWLCTDENDNVSAFLSEDEARGYKCRTEKVRAREIPVGTRLNADTFAFFKFWRGQDAVVNNRDQRILIADVSKVDDPIGEKSHCVHSHIENRKGRLVCLDCGWSTKAP